MERLISLMAMTFCMSFVLYSQSTIVNFDKKSTEQVVLNTTMQEGVEVLHNIQVDSIKSKQNTLMGLTLSYSTLKTLYNETLKNAKGFREDSGIYKAIIKISKNIVTHSGEAIQVINKSSLVGKATAIYKVADCVLEAAQLGNLFFNIVNNAEISNPLQKEMTGAEAPQKDKYNFLNRHERLSLALKLLVGLQKIDNDLVMMKYYLQYATLSDLLLKVDRKTWITYHAANSYHQDLINQWNRFSK